LETHLKYMQTDMQMEIAALCVSGNNLVAVQCGILNKARPF
jgi:hypothetical protein